MSLPGRRRRCAGLYGAEAMFLLFPCEYGIEVIDSHVGLVIGRLNVRFLRL